MLSAIRRTSPQSKADEAGKGEELSSWAIFTSIASAFLLGMGLFVALPHFMTAVITSRPSIGLTAAESVLSSDRRRAQDDSSFELRLSDRDDADIHRVFQYHGAEHKSIYAFEAGEELTVENARKYTTLHPRCGTSFLLFLVVISILVFSIVFPLFGLTHLSDNPILNHVLMILREDRPDVSGRGPAYEFIKACACRMDNPIFRTMIWPGMILQKLTTREPDDQQLEVALASLRQVLLEKRKGQRKTSRCSSEELEISAFPKSRWSQRPSPNSPKCRLAAMSRMFDKLESVESRFVEIESRLADPDLANRPAEFRKLSQEHASLRKIVEEYRRLQESEFRDRIQQRTSSAKKTPKLSAMAKEELKRLEPEFEQSKKNLQILLLPTGSQRREERRF